VNEAVQFFSSADLVLALPLVLLTLFGLGILLIDLLLPPEWKALNAFTALAGLGFAAASVHKIQRSYEALEAAGEAVAPFTGFMGTLVVDGLAIYFFYLFLAGAAIAVLMSVRYLEIEGEHNGEYYALMLFAVVGMMALAAGNDIVVLFIGLELMSLATYVLVGYLRSDRRSNEGALKYLLLGAFSTGIFAYGLSLLYGLTGSTKLPQIASALSAHMAQFPNDPIAIVALLAVMAALFFKVAAAPFHQWAPDAYEGAPTCITGFMSVAVKAGAVALILRLLLDGIYPMRELYLPLVIFVAVATMVVGNLAAITQTNLKRLLAYSSIAHVGYMLLGLVPGTMEAPSVRGVQGILIYLLVYTFMNLGAFAVITALRRRGTAGDEMDDIAGLYFRAPTHALLMLVFLLSLAGIPPLAGFWGKWYIFLALIEGGHYVLAVIAVLYVAVAVYYYLRVANAMFMREPLDEAPVTRSVGMSAALAVTAVATLAIGVYPEPFIRATTWAMQMGVAGNAAGMP
jgi:NADH-quinone oxidoreductase subunit N